MCNREKLRPSEQAFVCPCVRMCMRQVFRHIVGFQMRLLQVALLIVFANQFTSGTKVIPQRVVSVNNNQRFLAEPLSHEKEERKYETSIVNGLPEEKLQSYLKIKTAQLLRSPHQSGFEANKNTQLQQPATSKFHPVPLRMLGSPSGYSMASMGNTMGYSNSYLASNERYNFQPSPSAYNQFRWFDNVGYDLYWPHQSSPYQSATNNPFAIRYSRPTYSTTGGNPLPMNSRTAYQPRVRRF